MVGKVVYRSVITLNQTSEIKLNVPAGIYFLSVNVDGRRIRCTENCEIKIIKSFIQKDPFAGVFYDQIAIFVSINKKHIHYVVK